MLVAVVPFSGHAEEQTPGHRTAGVVHKVRDLDGVFAGGQAPHLDGSEQPGDLLVGSTVWVG